MRKFKLKYIAFFFSIVLLILTGCQAGQSNQQKVNADGYELVWNDEFDYAGLPDSTKWRYDTEGNEAGWGNNEDQWYTEARLENARVENGILILLPFVRISRVKNLLLSGLCQMPTGSTEKLRCVPKCPKLLAPGLLYG
jgi:hypothetical protein